MSLEPPAADRWSVAPFWKVARTEPLTTLNNDEKCDVLIIGGGITGLATAYSLCQQYKVIVCEAAQIGEGSTGWSAGILSQATTIDLQAAEDLLGEEQSRAISFFLADAIIKAKNSAKWHAGDWQSGSSLYFAAKKKHTKLLAAEYNLRHKYGLPAEFLDGPHLKFWKNFPALLEMPGEHAVHPVKLLLGLASAIRAAGGKVYERTPAISWRNDSDEFITRAGNHSIRSQHLIVCKGLRTAGMHEFADLVRMTVPVTGHVLVTQPSEEFAQFVKDKNRIAAWDSLQLYHYIRYFDDGRILAGGEDSPGECTNTSFSASAPAVTRLYRWLQSHHAKKVPPVEFAWKASLTIPSDGLPAFKITTRRDNYLIAAITDGIPFAFVLGSLIAHLIEHGEHPLAKLLSHRRPVPLASRMLSMIPTGPLRNAALQAAFTGMHLSDLLL